MRELIYEIGPGYEGMRVGDYLKRVHGYSGKSLTKLRQLPDGLSLNGRHIRTVDPVAEGDRLRVAQRDPENTLTPCLRPVEVLWEDADVVVFNKPPAMPCHPSKGHPDDTLANVFVARYGSELTFRALNRLDADTTGCVLVCKNRHAASRLTGHVDKLYIGVVRGVLEGKGAIEAPVYRPIPFHIIRSVDERGQYAATGYEALAAGDGCTLARFFLYTGRTHQIRLHMSHIGRPLIGDSLYGVPEGPPIGRQALHCLGLVFRQPVMGQMVRVTAPLFGDMQSLLRHVSLPEDTGRMMAGWPSAMVDQPCCR